MTHRRTLSRGEQLDELIATIAILKANAVPPSKLNGLLEYVGSAVDLLPKELGGAAIEGRPMLLDAIASSVLEAVERDVEEWRAEGLGVFTTLDAEYPTNLQTVYDKPPFIFLRGRWDDSIDSRAVAIVGTRSASPDGCKRAFRLARQLAEANVTIISGLAKGIDASAHQGALAGRGRTAAVLGTGINLRYPAENATLAADIVTSGGALFSQFFPAQPPTRWTFPLRNRTMSGLSLATIVIEAGATSGAKMQAEAALVHGRPVFLPSSLVAAHPWAKAMVEEGHRGSHAIEVSSAEDVIERLDLSAEAGALIA